MKNKWSMLYYIAISILFFVITAGWSSLINLGILYNVSISFSLLLLLIYFLSYRHNFKQLLIIFILLIILAYTFIKTKNPIFLVNFMLIISSKNIDIKRVIKIDIFIKLFFLIYHSVFYIFNLFFELGFIDNIYFTTAHGLRQSLFFSGPNALSAIVFWLIIDYLFLNKDKKIIRKSIICIIPLFICYIFAKTISTFYLYFVYLFLISISKLDLGKKIINIMHYSVGDILFGFSFLIVVFSNFIISHFYTAFEIVDKLLSNRLIYSVRAYNEYGLNLLANIPALINKDKYIIDNFYILTIISYGIIIYLVLSLISKMFHKKADIYSKIIIIVAFIYLFFEALSFNGGLCIFITLLGYLFYKDKKNEGDVS